jgi:hypothetical protein
MVGWSCGLREEDTMESLHSMTNDDMVDGGERKVPGLLDPQVATSSLILAK